jgi:hypothetical protein
MKTSKWINWIVILALLFALFGVAPLTEPVAYAATIVHVKPGGSTSAGCGTTWATACELQTALTTASAGTEIWVAAGTYKPGVSRADTFQLRSGVALYGGLVGTETSREQRDWGNNESVLSGDIGVLDDNSDNSYHVVIGSYVDVTAVLDGFTITDGYSDIPTYGYGGGIYNTGGSPTLANVTISGNYAFDSGGGMYNIDGSPSLTNVTFIANEASNCGGMGNLGSPTLINVTFKANSAGTGLTNGGGMCNHGSPTLTNVTFNGNKAGGYGGGMISGSNPTLTDVIFSGNSAAEGGGMYNDSGSPTLTNLTFIGNSAYYGGGLYNRFGSPTLTNVTFSGNVVGYFGGGLYNSDSNPTITNTILWSNTAGNSGPQIYNDYGATLSILYSDVQGGCTTIPGNDCSGGGNIDADPLFVRNPHPGLDGSWGTTDDDYGDLRLKYGSPGIDAGNNAAPALIGIATDLGGKPRFYDVPGIADTGVGPAPVVDMGAYEKQANDAPSAGNDSYKTNVDIPLHINAPGVLANDSEPDGDPLSAVLESDPSLGSLTLNPDGSFDYLPEKDFSGVVTFTYHANDGVLNSNPAKVTIIVINNSDAYLPLIKCNVIRSCPPLYQDDFSNPDSGWPIVFESDYRLEYLNGKYSMWLDHKDGLLAASPDFLAADYSLSTELQNVNGVYGSYGLIFGLSSDWSQFYTFEIDPQGNYSIFLYNNENWSLLAEGYSSAINQGSSPNHLKIVRDGTLIEAWVNGQLMISISNGAYTGQRYVGLIISTYDDLNLDVHFDNFLVEALSCGAVTLKSDENLSLMRNWERGEQFTRSPRK